MIKSFEHGGNIHQALRENMDLQASFLDFSANINPLGLPEQVKLAITAAIPQIIHYPDVEGYRLKKELCNYYQVPYDQITLGNGAVELLYILCHLLKPKRVLLPVPSFSEYERAAKAVEAQISYYFLSEETNFTFDIQHLCKQLVGYDIVFLGNPNNPTGTIFSKTELKMIIKQAEKYDCFVVLDESFIDFLDIENQYSSRSLINDYKNLIILQSLTKFYAIPGLRLGFALSDVKFAQKLQLMKDPWNVNSLAQVAGIAALQSREYQEQSRKFLLQEKEEFFLKLKQIHGFKAYKPMVNFILVNIADTSLTSFELRDALYKENILIRDCSNYPGLSEKYVRFAIKMHNENNILIEKIKQILLRGENK